VGLCYCYGYKTKQRYGFVHWYAHRWHDNGLDRLLVDVHLAEDLKLLDAQAHRLDQAALGAKHSPKIVAINDLIHFRGLY